MDLMGQMPGRHGYPVVPAVFLAAVVYLVASALIADPMWTCVTFAIILCGLLLYRVVAGNARE